MDITHLLKSAQGQFADADEDGNSHHSSASSSSGFNDDDPRLQALFATEPYPRPGSVAAGAPAKVATPIVIDENVLINCFEWSVDQYNLTQEELGFWVAPNEENVDESMEPNTANTTSTQTEQEDKKIAAWNPASLNLPSWAIPESDLKSTEVADSREPNNDATTKCEDMPVEKTEAMDVANGSE